MDPRARNPEMLEAMVAACRRLYGRNMLAATDGNVSVLLEDGTLAITPSGAAKAFMDPRDMAFLGRDGTPQSGQPSAERRMHLAVYARCPQARAVVHAHPPTAIAWTVAHPDLPDLPADALPEVILATGRIPVVPYAPPGSLKLVEAILPFLPAHRVLVLGRHGALAWGETLDEAVNGMERVEHAATILKLAWELGGVHPLAPDQVAELHHIRRQLGPRTL